MGDQTLNEYLASFDRRGEYAARTVYNEEVDCIAFQIADEAHIAEWVDEHLTLYRSALDERLIGWQIENVQRLLASLMSRRAEMVASGEDCTFDSAIGCILLAAYDTGRKDNERQSAYRELFSLFDPFVAVEAVMQRGTGQQAAENAVSGIVLKNTKTWYERTA